MATKRLLKELEQYRKDPSRAVPSLEPVSDDDLFKLKAALRGPEGTAYEGIPTIPTCHDEEPILISFIRSTLPPLPLSPRKLPSAPTKNRLPHPLLSP